MKQARSFHHKHIKVELKKASTAAENCVWLKFEAISFSSVRVVFRRAPAARNVHYVWLARNEFRTNSLHVA